MDFTYRKYRELLKVLIEHKYQLGSLVAYMESPAPKCCIVRHDVDSWPSNALQMAKLEAELEISATYYFRISPLSFEKNIISSIVALGHELGYHYEDLTMHNGNMEKAIASFQNNLKHFREFYPVKTIAMHGKPLSRWNNLDLWKKYDYREFGLVCEPYLSLNYDEILYLTDTGNCWDGHKYSIRDEVNSAFNYKIHSTDDLINHIHNQQLPDRILMNIHPARWNDSLLRWIIRYYILTLPKYQTKKWVKQWRKRR